MQAQTLEAVKKMTKDLKTAARILSQDEARFLVDNYYMMQANRLRTEGQIRSMTESGEPSEVLSWLTDQNYLLEKEVAKALDAYSGAALVGQWARKNLGIGPVIAAGLLAHIDIKKAPTVGHIWNFAGLNPGIEWNKGEKRPWNADLKVLCWKAGQSFVKVSGNEDSHYGKIYAERKLLETERNFANEYADQAKDKLEKVKIGKTTDAYKAYSTGKLPPAHIHARACRYAVKMFLSDLHCVWYFVEYGELPPKPYAIAHLGHAHINKPPHAEMIPGLVKALEAWH